MRHDQIENLWNDKSLRVVMRKMLRKMEVAAGHGMNGTDHSAWGRLGTEYWKKAVMVTMKPPKRERPHHCCLNFQEMEKPSEVAERRKRNKRVWRGGFRPVITYRRYIRALATR